jgi:hypothetical protein
MAGCDECRQPDVKSFHSSTKPREEDTKKNPEILSVLADPSCAVDKNAAEKDGFRAADWLGLQLCVRQTAESAGH